MENKITTNSGRYYLFICILIIGVFITAWYLSSWYYLKKEERLHKSFLITSNTIEYEITDINEVKQVLNESPSNYFIYISYPKDEKIYRFEKKIKKYIDTYNIKDSFYYLNITNYLEKEDLYTKLNKIFDTDKIEDLPTILYYENKVLVEVINGPNYSKFANILKSDNFIKD